MLGLDGSLTIQTFQMHPGDSIIIGSDGRDDIMLGMDTKGREFANCNKFLDSSCAFSGFNLKKNCLRVVSYINSLGLSIIYSTDCR